MKNYSLILAAAAAAVVLPSCVEPVYPGSAPYRRPYVGPTHVDSYHHYDHGYDHGYDHTYGHGGYVGLPAGARRVYYRGTVYYTHHGMWYRSSGPGYVIVRSPY